MRRLCIKVDGCACVHGHEAVHLCMDGFARPCDFGGMCTGCVRVAFTAVVCACAQGVYVAAREMAIASLAPKIEHSTYVVQGFGKIGGSASQFLHGEE
eukprot:268310-Chlamydomonas_euryale.AAC.1